MVTSEMQARSWGNFQDGRGSARLPPPPLDFSVTEAVSHPSLAFHSTNPSCALALYGTNCALLVDCDRE
jgi:hypothetical protein